MNKNNKHTLWVERYHPHTLDDYIFHDDNHRVSIERMIHDRTIPHLLFSGVQGTGKTALAKVIIEELEVDDMDVLFLNASDENSVDVMRDKIKNFVRTYAFGDFKVVVLDEADYLSQTSQGVLRSMMVEHSEEARFILTCNYENKITPPLKSRVQQFHFTKGDKNLITERIAEILVKEDVKWDIDLVDQYVSAGYPDVRKIINLVQQHSNDGVLRPFESQGTDGDYKFELLDLIANDDWVAARKVCCGNISQGDWEDMYTFLYTNLSKSSKFSKQETWEAGIVLIAKYLHQHSVSADPEINAAALFIELKYAK